MLHHHDRKAVLGRHVDGSDDVGQGLIAGRVLHLEWAVEVLLLDIDDDKGAAGAAYGFSSVRCADQDSLTRSHRLA